MLEFDGKVLFLLWKNRLSFGMYVCNGSLSVTFFSYKFATRNDKSMLILINAVADPESRIQMVKIMCYMTEIDCSNVLNIMIALMDSVARCNFVNKRNIEKEKSVEGVHPNV